MPQNKTLTAIEGIRVGHVTHKEAKTGCTVVLCPERSKASIDIRGAAPGTRETGLLQPENTVEFVHGILLTGGSAYGLDAAGGVMQYLEEKDIGMPTIKGLKVPIVPAAVIFDLAQGSSEVRPDKEMGYQACQQATDQPVKEGRIGAGTGATVGKILGPDFSMPGGVGTSCLTLPSGIKVAALVVVNACGDVVDPKAGKILAGARDKNGKFIDSVEAMTNGTKEKLIPGTNTTLAVIATNVTLSKAQLKKLSQMAHDGMAWAIRPVHTLFDGDTIFAVSVPTHDQSLTISEFNALGIAACQVLSQAIVRSVQVSE